MTSNSLGEKKYFDNFYSVKGKIEETNNLIYINFLKSVIIGNISNITVEKYIDETKNDTIIGTYEVLNIVNSSEFSREFKTRWKTNSGETDMYMLYSWDLNYNITLSVMANSSIIYKVHYSTADIDLKLDKFKFTGHFYKYSNTYKKNIKYSFIVTN